MTLAALLQLLVAIVDAMVQGVPEAITAYNQVKAMAAAGVDPTPEQWADLNAQTDAIFAQVQAAGPKSVGPTPAAAGAGNAGV